jgi:hypothetical protein
LRLATVSYSNSFKNVYIEPKIDFMIYFESIYFIAQEDFRNLSQSFLNISQNPDFESLNRIIEELRNLKDNTPKKIVHEILNDLEVKKISVENKQTKSGN